MNLEDKLIENLVMTYKLKGINVQRVLQNPLFNTLSLSEKIKMIEKYSKELASAPKMSYNGVGHAAVAGGVLALTGSAGRMLMMGGPAKGFINPKLALTAGALIGAGAKYIQNKYELSQDREIAHSVGNPYSTIVLNSMRKERPAPDTKRLHEIATILGSSKLDADKPQ